TGEPVMGVDDVEVTNVVFGLKYMVDERPAHVVDFVYKVRVQVKRAAVIVDAVDARIVALAVAHACEHMHFVAFPLQRGGQLRNVHSYAAYCNRMQRLPGKHCDSHDTYRRRVEDKTEPDRKRWKELRAARRFSDPARLLRQTIGGLEFLRLQPVAAFRATSAIIVKHENYYVRINQIQPGVFRISGVAIHEEIGLVWRTRFEPRSSEKIRDGV